MPDIECLPLELVRDGGSGCGMTHDAWYLDFWNHEGPCIVVSRIYRPLTMARPENV